MVEEGLYSVVIYKKKQNYKLKQANLCGIIFIYV